MSYTNGLDKPSDYFNTVLWTGNGTGQSITGVGFSPEFLWLKERTSTSYHRLSDIIRGTNKQLSSNVSDAEETISTVVSSYDSDGFTVGADNGSNESGQTYVGWNWLAGGTGVSNTDGSITSTVSANTTSGFSIVSYTGTGSVETIGHGLGVAPSVVICKARSITSDWQMYHAGLGATQLIRLNLTNATLTNGIWQDTAPTNNVFYIGASPSINGLGQTNVAYCFAEKKGFSKFGSYTGNGNADGTFVYTGFKPAMVIKKRSSSTGNWQIEDNKRDTGNPCNLTLFPDLSNAEDNTSGAYDIDMLSNGFKLRATNTHSNASGSTYIYMAFAENPFTTSTGIPTTAR